MPLPPSPARTVITVAVVGHVARQNAAHHLTRALGGRLFLDNGELGETANHRRAWTWAATQPSEWTLIIQDDAIPIGSMLQHLSAGLATLPRPGLVSLYLGTSYPTHWQRQIRAAIHRADEQDAAWIESTHLLHGVAVAAPTSWASFIGEALIRPDTTRDKPYDETVCDLARSSQWPVFYTWPSLVDHADGPTLLEHPDGRGREKPRHAWRTGAPNWNSRIVRL